MKKVTFWTVSLAIAVALSPMSARAVLIDMDYLLGTVTPGTPSDLENETNRLQFLVDQYNLGNLGDLGQVPGDPQNELANLSPGSQVPANLAVTSVVAATGQLGGSNGPLPSINFGTGYEYLLIKWGSDDAFYYVGGISGAHSVQNDVVLNRGNGNPLGESHYVLFNGGTNRVPDGGATLILLGSALGGIGLLKRRLG